MNEGNQRSAWRRGFTTRNGRSAWGLQIAVVALAALPLAGCPLEPDEPAGDGTEDGAESEDEAPESTFVACEQTSIINGETSWHCTETDPRICPAIGDGSQVPYPDRSCASIGYRHPCGPAELYYADAGCGLGPHPRASAADRAGGGGGGGERPDDEGGGGTPGPAGDCSATLSGGGRSTEDIAFTEQCAWSVQEWRGAPGDQLLVIQMMGPEGETDDLGGTPQNVLIIVIDAVDGRSSFDGSYSLRFAAGSDESYAVFQEIDIVGSWSTHYDRSLEGQSRGTVEISSAGDVLSGTFDLRIRVSMGEDLRLQGEFNAAASSDRLFEPAVR